MHIQKKIWVALWAASTFVGVGLGVGAFGPTFTTQVQAQAIPKSLEQGGPDAELRARKNQWTVGVAGGLLSGSNMTFADELAQVLDDGENLRILANRHLRAASNLDDLLYLRGVDVAITNRTVRVFPHGAQDGQSREPHQLHHTPAHIGNARPGA